MSAIDSQQCIAFEGDRRIAQGPLVEVALAVKEVVEARDPARVLVFDSLTSQPVEFDLRGSADDVASRLRKIEAPASEDVPEPPPGPKKRGRPKLGVVGREVTLLPRHWEWLGRQPGGASVTLRKLVDRARQASAAGEKQRQARDATYRFMVAIAGNHPGFEEATRALFAGLSQSFARHTEAWPEDVRAHTRRLASMAFEAKKADA